MRADLLVEREAGKAVAEDQYGGGIRGHEGSMGYKNIFVNNDEFACTFLIYGIILNQQGARSAKDG
jgi:hypothetical protein